MHPRQRRLHQRSDGGRSAGRRPGHRRHRRGRDEPGVRTDRQSVGAQHNGRPPGTRNTGGTRICSRGRSAWIWSSIPTQPRRRRSRGSSASRQPSPWSPCRRAHRHDVFSCTRRIPSSAAASATFTGSAWQRYDEFIIPNGAFVPQLEESAVHGGQQGRAAQKCSRAWGAASNVVKDVSILGGSRIKEVPELGAARRHAGPCGGAGLR